MRDREGKNNTPAGSREASYAVLPLSIVGNGARELQRRSEGERDLQRRTENMKEEEEDVVSICTNFFPRAPIFSY